MIESGPTSIYSPAQRNSGQVLFRNVYIEDASEHSPLPGLWLLVSQAAAAGAFAAFVTSAIRVLCYSMSGSFLVAMQLPFMLVLGCGVGALKGVTIWTSTKLFRRVPGPFVRSVISLFGIAGIWAVA